MKKYAGSIIYDSEQKLNVVVSEVKSKDDSAIESQHTEQMVELWKNSQQAMLGFDVYGEVMVPKVLLKHDGMLKTLHLKKLHFTSELDEIIRLIQAFLLYVPYAAAQDVAAQDEAAQDNTD